MSAAPPTLDLRLGIVRDGAIVREQRVPLDRPLGIDLDGLTDARAVVCVGTSPEGPVLRSTRMVRVRLGRKGTVERLVLEAGRLQLRPGDQVRVDVDGVVLLLHLVPHKPVVVDTPFDLAEFRPLLVERDDPLFLGLVSLFSAAAAALLVVVAQMPVVEVEEPEPIPDRVLVVLRPPVEPEVEAPEPVVEAVEVAKARPRPVPTPEPEPVVVEPEPEVVADATPMTARDQAIERLGTKSAALGRLDGIVASLTAEGSEDALMEAFDAIPNAEPIAAKGSAKGLIPQRGGGGREDAGLLPGGWGGPRGGGRGGSPEGTLRGTEGLDRAPVQRHPVVGIPRENKLPKGVLDEVQRRYKVQLKRCYTREVNLHPELAGRVELSFDVEKGKVAFYAVTENTTGSRALEACIEQRAARWQFADDAEGSFVLPLVFEPG